MSETKELKKAQQELKEAQHALKLEEAKDKREVELQHLEWEKEKFRLQMEHEKERWAFDSKAQEHRLSYAESQRMSETLQSDVRIIYDLKERIGGLTAQVAMYKPFFDKHMEDLKSETSQN